VGPLRSLSIPLPEPGGVVVLRGRNGPGRAGRGEQQTLV